MNLIIQSKITCDGTAQAVVIRRGYIPSFHIIGGDVELLTSATATESITMPEGSFITLGLSHGQTLYVRGDSGVSSVEVCES